MRTKNDLEEDAAATQWAETEETDAPSSPAPTQAVQAGGSPGDLGIAEDQELAARQPDEANELASLSSADISQLSGQVHKAEELLPLQLYGTHASDAATLKTMVQSHMEEVVPQIQAAYNDSLPTDPQLSGAVVLEFSLTADGRVSRAVGHSTGIENVEFLQAVQSLATQWSFSPIESQTADITVFYPILLTPSTVQSATFLSHLKEVWPGRYKILSATPIPVYNRSDETAKRLERLGWTLYICD